MSRDSSYAEYVDLRWWKLYRLATLLVGEERAEDVTARALARAYVSWPEVRAATSPDEHLEEILSQVAIEEPDVAGGDGFDGLPVRRRVAVVLRCIELLTDVEVARALACRPPDVEAEVSTALRALGVSADELTAELERRSEATVVPPAPIESLLARGHAVRWRRQRRLLTWMVAVAATVIAALTVTTLLVWASRSPPKPIPATLAVLSQGHRPQVAYLEGGTLHLGDGRSVELGERPDSLVQAAHWVYLNYPSGRLDRVHTESLATTTVTTSSAGQVVADARGRYVAWVEARPHARHPRVVVRAIDSRGETLQQQQLSFPAGRDPFVLAALDRSGDVFGSRPMERNGTWVWHAGLTPAPERGRLEPVAGLGNGTMEQVVAGDVVVRFPGRSLRGPPRRIQRDLRRHDPR